MPNNSSSATPAHDPWKALSRIAHRQRGMFTAEEARSCGFTDWAIRTRIERNEWEVVAPRVLRVSVSARLDWLDRLVAEQLSSDVVATGWSGLALFDLAEPPTAPELLVERTRRNLERRGVHSTLILPQSDLTRVNGVRCTTVERSLIYAAGPMTDRAVELLVIKAVARRRATLHRVAARAEALRHLPLPGPYRLLRAIDRIDPAIDRARNEWEALIVDACSEFGLPAPILNYKVRIGGRVRFFDAAWPPAKVASEYDGFVEHLTSRDRFVDDRTRHNDALDAGWALFRLTSQQLRAPRRATEFEMIARAIRRHRRSAA